MEGPLANALDHKLLDSRKTLLQITVSGLGTSVLDPATGQSTYVKGDDCLACLADLARYIREDESRLRLVIRQLIRWRIVEMDLVPLLLVSGEDRHLFRAGLRLLVALTGPLAGPSAAMQALHRTSDYTAAGDHADYLARLKEAKGALLQEKVFRQLSQSILLVFAKRPDMREAYDLEIGMNCLLVVRNLARISDSPPPVPLAKGRRGTLSTDRAFDGTPLAGLLVVRMREAHLMEMFASLMGACEPGRLEADRLALQASTDRVKLADADLVAPVILETLAALLAGAQPTCLADHLANPTASPPPTTTATPGRRPSTGATAPGAEPPTTPRRASALDSRLQAALAQETSSPGRSPGGSRHARFSGTFRLQSSANSAMTISTAGGSLRGKNFDEDKARRIAPFIKIAQSQDLGVRKTTLDAKAVGILAEALQLFLRSNFRVFVGFFMERHRTTEIGPNRGELVQFIWLWHYMAAFVAAHAAHEIRRSQQAARAQARAQQAGQPGPHTSPATLPPSQLPEHPPTDVLFRQLACFLSNDSLTFLTERIRHLYVEDKHITDYGMSFVNWTNTHAAVLAYSEMLNLLGVMLKGSRTMQQFSEALQRKIYFNNVLLPMAHDMLQRFPRSGNPALLADITVLVLRLLQLLEVYSKGRPSIIVMERRSDMAASRPRARHTPRPGGSDSESEEPPENRPASDDPRSATERSLQREKEQTFRGFLKSFCTDAIMDRYIEVLDRYQYNTPLVNQAVLWTFYTIFKMLPSYRPLLYKLTFLCTAESVLELLALRDDATSKSHTEVLTFLVACFFERWRASPSMFFEILFDKPESVSLYLQSGDTASFRKHKSHKRAAPAPASPGKGPDNPAAASPHSTEDEESSASASDSEGSDFELAETQPLARTNAGPVKRQRSGHNSHPRSGEAAMAGARRRFTDSPVDLAGSDLPEPGDFVSMMTATPRKRRNRGRAMLSLGTEEDPTDDDGTPVHDLTDKAGSSPRRPGMVTSLPAEAITSLSVSSNSGVRVPRQT
ncbi:hypothetical protein H696_00787 [Fonticula alba]|uniref:Timeless N-terminal domain-containing protein n=1 Tax=Fonticula alba TaxID=691883 RepID=A0A058ZH04_FONAL|nr:hypothetical protein H696_00787 [Fonticula alba]KCV73246.1 hypothetical protein H696_00787 [Fonticula alba]|eukprot:XP_009492947.1 hypothetical protein H696_00787 [Fonticula alba]